MKAAIIGFGKSGKAAQRLLATRGINDVVIFDDKNGLSLSQFFDDFDITVVSPGVNPKLLAHYPKKITSELELGLCNLPRGARVIAITGTDGKSTTTSFCAQILRASGYKAIECGNFGYPLADAVLDFGENTIFVLEVSSYQLDLLPDRPLFDAAAILNIAPDHLDRYGNFENYISSKNRIKNMLKPGALFLDSVNVPHKDYPTFRILGEHNKSNLNFATTLASATANLPNNISDIISDIYGLEHRIEVVPTNDGLNWYNDSKGTTVQAVLCALKSFNSNVILMLGGRDKNLDFVPLSNDINLRCNAVVLFGEAGKKINSQIKNSIERPIIMTKDLQSAVSLARGAAHPGTNILLSPGCTSFDQFKSFEERGNAFKKYVKAATKSK